MKMSLLPSFTRSGVELGWKLRWSTFKIGRFVENFLAALNPGNERENNDARRMDYHDKLMFLMLTPAMNTSSSRGLKRVKENLKLDPKLLA